MIGGYLGQMAGEAAGSYVGDMLEDEAMSAVGADGGKGDDEDEDKKE